MHTVVLGVCWRLNRELLLVLSIFASVIRFLRRLQAFYRTVIRQILNLSSTTDFEAEAMFSNAPNSTA